MSTSYVPVLWNKSKKSYDKILWLGIGLFIVSFIVAQYLIDAQITPETLIIRTSSLVAIILLHIILIIGPLCRLNDAFLPLLYNRRHMGVTMFVFAAIHGIFSMIQFHALGNINPILSLFLSNTEYLAISEFPFQILGFFALIIFFLMAATSHDFWLKNLGPSFWKAMHMLVYVAYILVILHVALGILQYENKLIYWIVLILGFTTIAGLHLWSGIKTNKLLGKQTLELEDKGFQVICPISEIPEDCAKAVFINDQNIAVFKYDGLVSAVSNVCKHQMGPLAEGRVIDGCITCPWHGYQYYPHNGQSPPPYEEKLATYQTKVIDGMVWINPIPHEEGTFVEPTPITV